MRVTEDRHDSGAGARWKQRPEGSNWGDFGPDDELGRLNLITPAKVREGVEEVKEGLVFCLSLPLDLPGGRAVNKYRAGPILRPILREPGETFYNFDISRTGQSKEGIVSDDLTVLHLQYSTHWDALCHYGMPFDCHGNGVQTATYYNGFQAGEHVWSSSEPGDQGLPSALDTASTCGAKRLGIQNYAQAGIQTRAVLLDLRRHLGSGRRKVRMADLRRIIDADGIECREGDILLLHTGFAQAVLDMGGAPNAGQLERTGTVLDGTDPELHEWIRDSGFSAIAADNYAVEQPPHDSPSGGAVLPLHELCLFKLGIPLGEMWHLTQLAAWLEANKRHALLLTAPPLRLPGAAGSPVTPIATV